MTKEILTLEDVAEYLSLSLSTVKKWAWMRLFPVVKLGEGKKAPLRVRKKDLDCFIEKKLQHNTPETSNIAGKIKNRKNISKGENLDEFFKRIGKN